MSLPSLIKSAYGWVVGRDFGQYSRSTDPWDDSWFANGWGVKSSTGIMIDQSTAMSCAAVMSCVSILSEDVAKLTPKLWRPKTGGGREEAKDHYLYPFTKAPNNWQTWGDFCTQMMVGLCLRGNAYAVIVRDYIGRPLYLVPINPDKIALWESPNGDLFWMVTRTGLHQMALLKNEPLLIPNRDILHFKGLSANGLLGLSKITLNREAVGLALAQEQQAARWMGNAAKPSGILSTDKKMSKESYDRSKASWLEANSGLANSGKTAMLEEGLTWQQLSMTSADIEFIASRTFQLQEIARMWRIPPHMIGEMSRSTNNNITQQSQEYYNTTLSTYTKIIKDRMEFTFGLWNDDIYIEFDRSILLEGDIQTRFNLYRTGLQGVFTSNECREREGMDPAPEGDETTPFGDQVFRPVNMVPLGSDVARGSDVPGLGSDQGGDNPGGGAPSESEPDPDQSARMADVEDEMRRMAAEITSLTGIVKRGR